MSKVKKEKKSFDKRKFRYGTLATTVTVVFVVALVLLNILASELTKRFDLKVDTTAEQIFAISDQTKEYLATIDKDVEISVMIAEEDMENGTMYTKLIKEIAEKYGACSDKISINFYDTEKNPEVVNKYSEYYSDSINYGDIVVFSEGRIKVLAMTDLFEVSIDYYTYTQQIEAVKADEALTSAVMFVADPNPPKMAILECQQSDSVAMSLAQLSEMFASNGYVVETIDPLKQDISTDYDMVILAAPYSDLTETVIDKIDAYLYNDGDLGKNLFYMANYDQRETPNVDAFLKEWGIEIGDGYIMNSDASSTIAAPIQGLQSYFESPMVEVADDYKEFINSEKIPMIMPASRPINLLFTEDDDRETSVMLTTPATCAVVDMEGNAGELTSHNVFVRGSKNIFVGPEKISSNVIVSGSAYFLDSLIESNSLNNKEFAIKLVNRYTGKDHGITILPKSLLTDVLNISESEARGINIAVIVVIPLIVVVIGMGVFLRRKYR